jgi:hypothetical protein
MITYKAAYWIDGDGVHAEVLDFPGVMTCHKNLRKARRWLADALEEMADLYVSEGMALPVPNPQIASKDADIEEPSYLVLQAANRYKIVAQKVKP